MLQNGTVINGVMIEKPHKFLTASTIATQIILCVSSSQYGGCTITLTHLAPFVRYSFLSYLKESIEWIDEGDDYLKEIINEKVWPGYNDIESKYPKNYKYAISKLKKEINAGVQTFNYQVNSMSNTNGQAPFLTVFMYLNETDIYKDELAMIIEEFLNQRILGFKNSDGIYVTPAFPKLIYALEKDNIYPDSKYYYLTELSAKCTAKRMVPDYISEKIMKEYKIDENGNGNCYPSMGCVDGEEIITYKFNGNLYVESFSRMWSKMSTLFPIKNQYNDINNPNLYIDLDNVEIYDTKLGGFTQCYRLIRNISDNWLDVSMSNGRRILCTNDHPFEIINRGVILGKDLNCGDKLLINKYQYSENNFYVNPELAWTLGVILCNGTYNSDITVSINSKKDKIESRYKNNIKSIFNISTETIIRNENNSIYKDITSISELSNENYIIETNRYLNNIFEGTEIGNRHIPSLVFNWSTISKLSFLSGIIDSNGNIDKESNEISLELNNKEIALQIMALVQSLEMPSEIYYNADNSEEKYIIKFTANQNLLQLIDNYNKNNNYNISINNISNTEYISEIISINPVYERRFSYDVTTASEHFEVSGIYSHNCRSFLTPYLDKDKKPKYYGRLNCGVVTISLPDIALSSGRDLDKFWELFEERTELCHKALRIRYDRVANATSDVAPILWQNGAFGRLKPGEKIENLIKDGYCTISLGYAGLYECVLYMTGESHSAGKGKEFGLEVMQRLNDKCNQWKKAENISYSLYGTPIESTTYKFAKNLRRRFGLIKDITDRNYITNSYHYLKRV